MTECMIWPSPGKDAVVEAIILDEKSTAKRTMQRWAIEKEAKVGVGDWIWWTDESPSNDS